MFTNAHGYEMKKVVKNDCVRDTNNTEHLNT
jgi:hypothetical protein